MGATDTTNFERVDGDGFVKIGGALPDSSDPRMTIKGRSAGTNARRQPTSSSSLYYLRIIDSRHWHYSELFAISFDFFIQLLAVSFTTSKTFETQGAGRSSRYFSSILMLTYWFDMLIRLLGLGSALWRSHSNIGDLLCLVLMSAILGVRWVLGKYEYYQALGYLVLLCFRLVLKPRARTFSKKLHKFRSNGDYIRISIESLRASLARIPGISALAIETMETDLIIICGRDTGDMSRDELMAFLGRALQYRPPQLTATEFLSHLRDIDASSSQVAYGPMDVVRSTLGHWSNQRGALIFCLFVIMMNAAISPMMAFFLSKLSTAFISYVRFARGKITEEELRWDQLNLGIAGILGLCVPFVLGDYAIGYFQSKMISKATEQMQTKLLDVVLRQGTGFFAERSEGDLNNMFSSDIARVNALWQAVFWNLLNPFVGIVFGFGYAAYIDPLVGIVAFSFAGALLSSGPQGFAAQRSKEFGSKNAYVAADFQNAVSCHKVVRAYAIQTPLVTRFNKSVAMLRETQFAKDFWASIVQIYIESAMYIFTAIMTAALAMKVWRSEIVPGDFFGFVLLIQRIANPVTVLGGFMRVAIGNASSLQRIDDIIIGLGRDDATHDDDGQDKNLPSLPKMQRELRIEKLKFKYDKTSEQLVLNELSATIPRGAYACIVGPSGCGKSTLLSCLMQFQEPDGGCIRLDGQDIFNFSKRSFMDQTAVVFQDGGILNGTIYDNLRYGNPQATNAECEEAARLAECHFIGDLKDGFETIVGQHATVNLSGGQAQRICLARALCRKPSILILDEATSALDPETEVSIIETLEQLAKKMNMTILSVTHRMSTAENADVILVLNKGRVAEQGRYEELVRRGGLFYEMVHKVNQEEETHDDVSFTMGKKRSSAARHLSTTDGGRRSGGLHDDDSMGRPTDSALALQQFTKTLSTRVDVSDAMRMRYANRSRKQSEDTNGRRSQNSSMLNTLDNQHQFVPHQGRRQAASVASHTSEDERSQYFVL